MISYVLRKSNLCRQNGISPALELAFYNLFDTILYRILWFTLSPAGTIVMTIESPSRDLSLRQGVNMTVSHINNEYIYSIMSQVQLEAVRFSKTTASFLINSNCKYNHKTFMNNNNLARCTFSYKWRYHTIHARVETIETSVIVHRLSLNIQHSTEEHCFYHIWKLWIISIRYWSITASI